jgi:hypothetical protein
VVFSIPASFCCVSTSTPNAVYLFAVGTIGRDSLTLPPAVLPTTSGGKDDDSLPETLSSTSQSSHNLSTESAIAPTQKYFSSDREEASENFQSVQKDAESQSSQVAVPLQDLDTKTNTKHSNNTSNINGMSFDGGTESSVPVPVAPPRRKKRKPQTPRSLTVSNVLNIISILSCILMCFWLH